MSKHKPDPTLAALSDSGIVLVTLWGEARGEPIEGQAAVANVIRNRLDDGRWGSSYHEVCLAWAQFSCLWPTLGGPNFQRVIDFASRYMDRPTPSMQERQLGLIVQGLFSNSLADNTHGATHYYSPEAMAPVGSVPKWAVGKEPIAIHGRHRFFARVR